MSHQYFIYTYKISNSKSSFVNHMNIESNSWDIVVGGGKSIISTLRV